jgi:hypothetical protein
MAINIIEYWEVQACYDKAIETIAYFDNEQAAKALANKSVYNSYTHKKVITVSGEKEISEAAKRERVLKAIEGMAGSDKQALYEYLKEEYTSNATQIR